MVDKDHSPGECPSCGRFVGPYEKCPYCGAAVGQRMAVRVFRYGSLALAVVGLAVLLFVATRSRVPTVEIGSLAGTMNWAYVRVEGTVIRQPAYDPEARSLTFWVWDGTGEIMVTAYRSEAEWLQAHGLVPVMGDGVAVEGTLRVKEDFQYLILNVPQHVEVRPTAPLAVTIAEVNEGLLYQKVTVRGVVRDDRTPYAGLRILTLRDSSGQIDVTLPATATLVGDSLPDVKVGQAVQVTGAVDRYKGTPQISVGRGSDVVVLEETISIAPPRAIGDLGPGDVGGMVAVEGVVTGVSPFSAGVKCTLDDGSGTVTLLLWQDLYDGLPEHGAPRVGMMVRAQGVVSEYRGELEIVPEIPSDVVVLAAAERTVAGRRLGELAAADVGQTVQVEGVLVSLRTFSAGVRGTLDDGTGTVTLLLWQDVYDGLPDPAQVVPGAELRVVGEVREYKGELEVVPQAPGDVTVVGMTELPAEERAIGRLTADDVGQTVQVVGQIVTVTPFSRGIKYTLDDGTGAITLLLWQDLLDRLTDPAALAVGAQVSVRGQVDEYQGELEIVPQVPGDVRVTGGEVAQVTPTVSPTPEPTAQATAVPSPTAEPTATPTAEPTALPTPSPTRPPTPTATPVVETRTIGAITAADVGATFTIAQAGIAEKSYFSKGVRYTLTDPSGSIILLVWQNVLEEIPDRYDLAPGNRVRVTGEIDQYQGELEIVPQDGADVIVVTRGERPPVEERAANAITPSDEGRVFVVEGKVARVESKKWLKLWLSDGTGELLIYVPERAVEYLPAGLGTGVRVRVTGEVDIYQGQIEIIPLAGADVEVVK